MPKDFEICQSQNGKMRTIKIGKTKYAHICIDKSGKSHMGEIKIKKIKKNAKK